MTHRMQAALGFRAHTGWAAAVAVATRWDVVERRRIAYEPEATRFIYHHAAEIAFDDAKALIETARAQAADKAGREIQDLIDGLSGKGITVIAACIPGGNARLPDALVDILAVHSRIHAAEGAFYRDVLADACAHAGLRVSRVPERDLWTLAGKASRAGAGKLRDRVAALGKQLGPPWGKDQKLAALAAVIGMTTQT